MSRLKAIALCCLFLLTDTADAITVAPWLEMSIISDRNVFGLRSKLDLKLRVQNRGEQTVLFYSEFRWGYLGTIDYKVFNEEGEELPQLVVGEDWQRADRRIDMEKLTPIESSRHLDFRETFLVSKLVLEPGRYVLKIMYVSPVKKATHNKIPVWNESAGPLLASFRFQVKEE